MKLATPIPQTPLDDRLRLAAKMGWLEGLNTKQIADALFVRESEVYNFLAGERDDAIK